MLQNIIKAIKKIRRSRSDINIIIIAVATVMIWRGIWGVLDKILFPNHEAISYIVSIALGIGILLIDDKRIKELSHH